MGYKVAEDVAWEDTPEVQRARGQYIVRDGERVQVLIVTWVGDEVWAMVWRENGATDWIVLPYQASVEIEESKR